MLISSTNADGLVQLVFSNTDGKKVNEQVYVTDGDEYVITVEDEEEKTVQA